MKKGFTLVELLAVIVILGLILSIAVPKILEVIENVRINVHIQNEEMMIRAAKNYIALNDEAFPDEIGYTKELTLEQLQTAELISVIKNPYNNNEECNGYILITKIEENNYEYNPHLNCFENINSAEDNRLVAHWKLDGNGLDSSGTGMHCTNYDTSFVDCKFGKCANFRLFVK